MYYNMIIPSHDMEYTASLEIDAQLKESVNSFWQLKDKSQNILYQRFTNANHSLSALFGVNLMLSGFSIPFLIVVGIFFLYCKSVFDYISWIIAVCFILFINLIAWWKYNQQKKIIDKENGYLSTEGRKFLHIFVYRLFLAIHCFMCYRLMTKVIVGKCHHGLGVAQSWNCNSGHEDHHIPSDSTIIIMLIPLIYSVLVRGAHLGRALGLWSISIAVLIFCVAYAQASGSILFIIYYAIGSLIILTEAKRMNFFLFFTHQRLQLTLLEQTKASNEANAIEMRHMIANVAHDLKTVRASSFSLAHLHELSSLINLFSMVFSRFHLSLVVLNILKVLWEM